MFSSPSNPVPRAPRTGGGGLGPLFGLLAGVAGVPLLVYYGALLLAGVLSTGVPRTGLKEVAVAVWTNPANPAAALPRSAGPAPAGWLVWLLFAALMLVAFVLMSVLWSLLGRRGRGREGTAGKAQLGLTLGRDAVRKRAARDRPSLAGVRKLDLRTAAVRLGNAADTGAPLWASHEDSIFVVGRRAPARPCRCARRWCSTRPAPSSPPAPRPTC